MNETTKFTAWWDNLPSEGFPEFREFQDWSYRDVANYAYEAGRNSILSVSDGWIDVKEKLPEGRCWAYHPHWGIREGEREDDYVFGNWAGIDHATHWMPLPSPPKDSPTSDGLEHSQHKCGCEEIDAIHKEEWEKQHAIIKAYREVLQNVVGNKGAWWIEAKEVLTRMEEEG